MWKTLALDDQTLDAVDRKSIEVVEKLERAELRPTDELVASKIPRSPRIPLSLAEGGPLDPLPELGCQLSCPIHDGSLVQG